MSAAQTPRQKRDDSLLVRALRPQQAGVDPRVGSEAQTANAKEARRLLCARVLLLHGVEVEQQVRLDERLRWLVQERDVLVLEAGEVQVLNVVLEAVLGVDRVTTPN